MDKKIDLKLWPPFRRSGTTLTQRIAGDNVDLLAGTLHLNDDTATKLGNTLASPNAQMLWETADANANALIVALPAGGAIDVPVMIIGDDTLLDKDLGLFNGVTAPTIAIVDADAAKALYMQHNGTDGYLQTTSGNIVLKTLATGKIVIDGTTTRTGTNEVLDIDATIDTTTATADVSVATITATRAAADTGGTTGLYISVTTGAQADTQDSYGIQVLINDAACSANTSDAIAFSAEAITADANVREIAFMQKTGWDFAFLAQDGAIQMGDATYDCGTFTMIKGAQVSDPQVQFALSADGNGNFSITADTGDITLTAADDFFVSVDGNIELALTGTALYPQTDGGLTLGISNTNEWGGLYMNASSAISWDNGNYTVTQSAGLLTTNGALTIAGALAGVTTIGCTGDITISGNTAQIIHSGTTSLSIVSTSGTVAIESVVFTGGAISSATTIGMAGDLTDYEAVNDGNPEIRIGAADAEELHIQTVYDAGGQTLNYVQFTTDVASATADKGKYVFNVDGSDIATIDDGGIEVTGTVNATAGFTDGTMTIDGSGAITGVTSLAMGGALSGVTTLALSQGITQTTTVTGTLYDMVLETEWTAGTLINADFGGATVQSGNMYGIVLDFNANLAGVTDQDVKAIVVKTPALTQSTANTTNYAVLDVSTAGALVQNTLEGFITWSGINLQMPNITQTTGTITSYGVYINGGTVTSGTQWAIFVDSGNVRLDGEITLGNDADNVSGKINFIASDGDGADISINTSDQLVFANAGGGYTFDADIIMATGTAIRSGVTNGNTLLIGSNDTTFITITSGASDTCVLASGVTATTQSANDNSTKLATTAYVDTAVGTVNTFAEILALSNITGANDIVVSTAQGISTALVDDNYFLIKAVDNDPNTASEVARAQGAVDPYFSAGGTQQFKFYNSGVAAFAGAATGAYFMSIAPTLTGPAATNTYAVNISPVGITIPTGTTAIAASLYVAEPIFTETGTLTLGANVYIDAAPTEGATNYSLYVVGTAYFGGTITGTLATAAQTNITSLGTLTGLTMGGSVISDTDITDDLGTGDVRWRDIYAETLNAGLTATDTLKLRGRDVNGTAWVDILTITSADTVTADLHSSVTIGGAAILYSGGNAGTPSAIVLTNASGTVTNLTLVTPALGTPASGVLTNCTGLPAAAVVAGSFGTGAYVMDSSLQVSTIELGHATQNTLSASGGVLSIEGVVIPTISSTNTLTNKRITKRAPAVTQSATPTINTDVTDVAHITGLAQAITSFTTNLSGTPVEGDTLRIDITDDGTARAITWGTSFEASTTALPTTTVISTRLDVGFVWNSVTSKWRCVAVA